MKTPIRLQPLIDANLIDEVVGQLQSGKEAEVYVVRCGDDYRCAKVYKEANNRTFKQKTQYTEGRSVRSSRRSRAMESNTKYGRQERESEWQSTEVEALTQLHAAGVSVPEVYAYYEGVLLLQMIRGVDGSPAPRLNDVDLTMEQARTYHETLVRQSVLMLCAGLIHGDLSEFNVLVASSGLVIIDFPQAVQATANNAFRIFERDLVHLTTFLGRVAPPLLTTEYPREIWKFYQNGKLKPDTPLTGTFAHSTKKADVRAVLGEIEEARDDEMTRRGVKKK